MDYGRIYGTSKKTTDDILGWVRSVSGASSTIALSAHRKLAEQAVRDGASLPTAMIDTLRTAINTRQELTDYHAQRGDLDQGHMHINNLLGQLFHLFCPEQIPQDLQSASQEACDYQAPSLYEPTPYFPQQYEQQEYAYSEYNPISTYYPAFYPQQMPPFAPYYSTFYPQEMNCGYFEPPTSPSDCSPENLLYTTINMRPSPDVRLLPQDFVPNTMPKSPTLSTCSSLFSEEDFPALPPSRPSSS